MNVEEVLSGVYSIDFIRLKEMKRIGGQTLHLTLEEFLKLEQKRHILLHVHVPLRELVH